MPKGKAITSKRQLRKLGHLVGRGELSAQKFAKLRKETRNIKGLPEKAANRRKKK